MAGHSQFKNIMYRKGAQDAKRAKIFTKIIRELTVSAKEGGSDPDSNPRLRAAIISAREANMPKDTVTRAIKRASGGDEDLDYQEIRYEGYGPGGVALIVECLTENRNRTASDVRAAFTKFGGNLGETNSVSFQFSRIGLIRYPASVSTPEKMFEEALEAGAEDIVSDSEGHTITCAADRLNAVREALQKKFGDPQAAKLDWRPNVSVPLDEETAKGLFKLIDALEDNDDVQTVAANYEVDEAILTKLTQ
ncbi:YebC/PmpR family DNA-binding transcriptional regulator [Candidatus Nucleicultrix amoebiphila]|jgi:YebC/PmpR family DNA-binding regulatory protein|uniref:Probable transcriptional regulatory protein GQ61_04400 n=1 Tax=Candidatus Nucleicultrix amoebiphila FS5 TaxID=1414854 RepID=A0A1W6N468_9PROT|nr:YebC/PmpR family DNA-binding transcriptional regulator [Candidatus Nucleicultrix amoebiphila]ARN84670.1 transcriptional regulator [Candidatus Nucleicultrix amoebiphila FS5]